MTFHGQHIPRRVFGRSADAEPPDATKPEDRILREARRLFATKGFDGTSMRTVARDADVNLASIRYYFGSKADLYFKVLREVLGPLGHRVLGQSNRPVPPLEQIEGVVREFFEHVHLNPDMPQLMVRELASGKDVSPPVAAMLKHSLPLLVGMISKGQQDGSIRAGDPTLLALSTLAQPVYLTLIRRAVEMDDPVEHAVVTIRAALEHRP